MLSHCLKLVVIAWASAVLLVVAGFLYKPAEVIPPSYIAATFFFVPLLLAQFIVARLVNRTDSAPKAPWWSVIKAWLAETRLMVRCFFAAWSPWRCFHSWVCLQSRCVDTLAEEAYAQSSCICRSQFGTRVWFD
jgi:hypothetical protein